MIQEKPSKALVIGAQCISYLLHPLFIPIYVAYFLLFIHPTVFIGFSETMKKQVMWIISLNVVAFPLITVLLLRALGFLPSLQMPDKKDRIIPYIACGIFFFWAFTVFRQQVQYPVLLTAFLFGIFLASSAALLANIYFKISMHAIGMGGLTAFLIVASFYSGKPIPWLVSAAFIVSGLVCSARLMISDHTVKDISAGLMVGAFAQFAAVLYLL